MAAGVVVSDGLIHAMDIAVTSDTRMRPEHIAGTLDWLMAVMAANCDHFVELTVDELHLVTKALTDSCHYAETKK